MKLISTKIVVACCAMLFVLPCLVLLVLVAPVTAVIVVSSYFLKRRAGIIQYHKIPATAPVAFEGWYFKLVPANGDAAGALVVIPGVYQNKTERFAFIQLYQPARRSVLIAKYAIDEFVASSTKFDVAVGRSRFRPDRFDLDVEGIDVRGLCVHVRGAVCFGDLKPWPADWANMGVMGPLGFLPLLECYHGVLGMSHPLSGTLEWREDSVPIPLLYSFEGGKGYLEKDWGREFPLG